MFRGSVANRNPGCTGAEITPWGRNGQSSRRIRDELDDRGIPSQLDQLSEYGAASDFSIDVASQLHVIAGTRSSGVILCSGNATLPYVDWIQDGLSMSSRLILHTDCNATSEHVRPHYSTDIRIAVHTKDLTCFLTDIEKHRFDLILVDADQIGIDGIVEIAERVSTRRV